MSLILPLLLSLVLVLLPVDLPRFVLLAMPFLRQLSTFLFFSGSTETLDLLFLLLP
jgi:hypothetical protein